MRFFTFIFILIIVVFGMSFAILNSESVNIDYYFNQATISLSLLLVLAFAFGCLIGMTASLWLLIKSKMKNYKLRQRLTLAEKEIQNLRSIPLQDKV